MNYEYSIVYAEDFQAVGDTPTFTDESDAFFHLAYMDERDQCTVIRLDDDGNVCERIGTNWHRIA